MLETGRRTCCTKNAFQTILRGFAVHGYLANTMIANAIALLLN